MKGIFARDWQSISIVVVLLYISIMPLEGGIHRILDFLYRVEITPDNARFFSSPIPVIVHILCGIPYNVLGALQVVPGFRHRYPRLHRPIGLFLIPCALIAALTSLWMTLFYNPWPDEDGELLYWIRLFFGIAMLFTIFLGISAVRRRDFASHGDWMLRAYAIGMGPGMQALTHWPWFALYGVPGELPRALLMAAGWIINLAVAEWVISIRRGRLVSFSRLTQQVR